MSWFPQFLNPLTALIASAIAIPSLLILYFLKLRRQEKLVSSTILWRKAIQDLQVNAPFQKLRRNLLLLLQMLILVALLLALANPIISYAPPPGKTTVLLIDRSASMSARDQNGKSRLDEAKRRAKDVVGALERDASAMVIAFDDSAEPMQPFTSDTSALRRAIDAIQPTDRKSKLKVAYQLAEAQTHFNQNQNRPGPSRPEVYLYSDGRVLDADQLRVNADVRYDPVGSDQAGNIAIVALSAKRNYERPAEVQVFARLANYGPDIVSTDVQLSVDGEVRRIGTSVTLFPERWTEEQRRQAEQAGQQMRDSVEYTVDVLTAAVVKIEQTNTVNDLLSADDSAQVVLPPPRSLSVLLVTDGNYFLEKALAALNLQKPQTVSPLQYENQKPKTFDVILFDRYAPAYMPEAGSLVWFGVAPPGSKITADTEASGALRLITDQGVLDWKRDHPTLRDLQLGKIYVGEAIKLSLPLEAEVLVDGLKCPLVVLDREVKATHIVVAFDVLQSNWPMKVSFPVFLHNTLQYLALGTEMSVRESYAPGATPRIPRASILKLDQSIKTIHMSGPENRDIKIPETGDIALPPLDRVGLYRTDPEIPGYEQLAVNLLDANESNLVPQAKAPGGVGETLAGGTGKSRRELWWWLIACAALPVLMIEWWVYTRRVHL